MIAIKRTLKRHDDHQEMDAALTKVLAAFGPREMLALVKAIVLTESHVHTIIHALAQQQRHLDESAAEAFTKFVTHDLDGIELYRIIKSTRGNEIRSDASRWNGSHFGKSRLIQ